MLGGLRHIDDGSSTVHIWLPYTFPTINGRCYHKESLEIIKDRFVVISPTDNSIARLIPNPGEPLIRPDHVSPKTYTFLRTLFLTRLPTMEYTGKKYYITRNNCGTLNPANKGVNIRTILNEDELIPVVKENGFEILQFEDYSFAEKIHIFNTAGVIISPNSGCLTFSLFANEHTKIIEILPAIIRDHDHYKNICETLGIHYARYTNVRTVGEPPGLGRVWNMIVDIPAFTLLLQSLL